LEYRLHPTYTTWQEFPDGVIRFAGRHPVSGSWIVEFHDFCPAYVVEGTLMRLIDPMYDMDGYVISAQLLAAWKKLPMGWTQVFNHGKNDMHVLLR